MASIAANVAVAPPDPIARTIAAWPAAAFAAAIKLLTTLLDAPDPGPGRAPRDAANRLRLPKTDRARTRWNVVWDDFVATDDRASELAGRHGMTSRQVRSILAAGKAGKLDTAPPDDPRHQRPDPAERSALDE